VRELIPAGWKLARGPGLDVAGRRVRLRFVEAPPPEELAEVTARLAELTGFTLD
jgi:hypothetical protein